MASVIGYSAPINLKALPATSSLNDTDLVLIQVGGQLQAITKADLASALGGGGSEAKYASFTPKHLIYGSGSYYQFANTTGYRVIPASTAWELVSSSSSSVFSASGDNFVFGETGVYRMDMRFQLSNTSNVAIIRYEVGNDTAGWTVPQSHTYLDSSSYPRDINFQYIYRVTDIATDQFRIIIYRSSTTQPHHMKNAETMINVYRIGDLTTS